MKTKYGIPQIQLDKIVKRDKVCVYCRNKFQPYDTHNRAGSATIEHLNYRADWDSVGDFVSQGKPVYSIIAICCFSCNASRSDLPLLKWFESAYCKDHKININTVSEVVREYINMYEKANDQI
jgi:hypothetical protein